MGVMRNIQGEGVAALGHGMPDTIHNKFIPERNISIQNNTNYIPGGNNLVPASLTIPTILDIINYFGLHWTILAIFVVTVIVLILFTVVWVSTGKYRKYIPSVSSSFLSFYFVYCTYSYFTHRYKYREIAPYLYLPPNILLFLPICMDLSFLVYKYFISTAYSNISGSNGKISTLKDFLRDFSLIVWIILAGLIPHAIFILLRALKQSTSLLSVYILVPSCIGSAIMAIYQHLPLFAQEEAGIGEDASQGNPENGL